MIASMKLLFCLEILEIMDIELEDDQVTWNQESVNLSSFMQFL